MPATPKGAPVAGGDMTITNKGSAPDRLVGGSTAVAGGFEVHSMTMDQGVSKMRPVEGGLEIKPGETVELKPGSFHVMLPGLKQPLEKGQKVKATLQFEKAGKVDIEYTVEAAGTARRHQPGTTIDMAIRRDHLARRVRQAMGAAPISRRPRAAGRRTSVRVASARVRR